LILKSSQKRVIYVGGIEEDQVQEKKNFFFQNFFLTVLRKKFEIKVCFFITFK